MPVVTVVTVPLVEPMVATPVVPLIHVPLGVVLVSVMLEPIHTEVGPPIKAGKGLTVTSAVVMQPKRV